MTHGETAIASYRFVVRVQGEGMGIHRRYRTTNVWLKRDGAVASHRRTHGESGPTRGTLESAASLFGQINPCFRYRLLAVPGVHGIFLDSIRFYKQARTSVDNGYRLKPIEKSPLIPLSRLSCLIINGWN